MKYLKTYNESVDEFFPGKSHEEIVKDLDKIPVNKRLSYIVKNKYYNEDNKEYVIDLLKNMKHDYHNTDLHHYLQVLKNYLTKDDMKDVVLNAISINLDNIRTIFINNNIPYTDEDLVIGVRNRRKLYHTDPLIYEFIKDNNLWGYLTNDEIDSFWHYIKPNELLIIGTKYGRIKFVETALRLKANISTHNYSPIVNAAGSGDMEIFKLIQSLLPYGSVDVERAFGRALSSAIQNKHYDIIKLLLDDERTTVLMEPSIVRSLKKELEQLNK